MTIISIDFSILYPGVCICKDFKDYKWIAVVNTNNRKKDKKNLENLVLEYPSIRIEYTESRRVKSNSYHITERNKLFNYLESTSLLIKLLEEEIDLNDDILVVIEGISFGSKGNALVDISQATGIIKNKLVDSILKGDTDRFFVFSPGELKNAIGCKGNAKKTEVFEKFLSDPILESVKTSDLYKAVEQEDWIREGDNIVSPVVDMIDSFLGITKIYKILNDKK